MRDAGCGIVVSLLLYATYERNKRDISSRTLRDGRLHVCLKRQYDSG